MKEGRRDRFDLLTTFFQLQRDEGCLSMDFPILVAFYTFLKQRLDSRSACPGIYVNDETI